MLVLFEELLNLHDVMGQKNYFALLEEVEKKQSQEYTGILATAQAGKSGSYSRRLESSEARRKLCLIFLTNAKYVALLKRLLQDQKSECLLQTLLMKWSVLILKC